MHLLEDSNQKAGQHTIKHEHFAAAGVKTFRLRLPFGDYAAAPTVVVDTKRDIYEIAGNIDHDHTRFRNECIRARDAGCHLIILVENEDGITCLEELRTWTESEEHYLARRGKKRITGKRLSAAMSTMSDRYGVTFMFCTPAEAGPLILKLLGGEGDA